MFPLLRLKGVGKSFPGARALCPIDLELFAGEVLGLIGENGAGKSTLIKILSGVHRPDEGTLFWDGQAAVFKTPHDALNSGIATIHQELAFFSHLSVAENLMMGEKWPRYFWGGVDWNRLRNEASDKLNRCGVKVSVGRFFGELSSAQRQEVAIARALSHRARLLILDEPTASLSEPEVERLFAQLKQLRAEGVAIIYVTHRLDEILRLTDRVAVLRDGALVAAFPASEATVERMVKEMVGRPLDQVYPHSGRRPDGEVLLELEAVSRRGMFQSVSFQLRAGEVVGLAGLVGAGRSELARAVYGLYPIEEGEMRLFGRPWRPGGPHQSIDAGLVYVPEERKRQGLVMDHSLADSIGIGMSDLLARYGIVNGGEKAGRIADTLKRYSIRARNMDQPVGTLSGGNQQKALLARWLERDPSLVILDEPTRGVDVGAKAEIHSLIDALAGRGKGVLLISSDLPEVIGMADRVLVMCEGRISAELVRGGMTQENVILAASGMYGEPKGVQSGAGSSEGA